MGEQLLPANIDILAEKVSHFPQISSVSNSSARICYFDVSIYQGGGREGGYDIRIFPHLIQVWLFLSEFFPQLSADKMWLKNFGMKIKNAQI